MLRLPFVSSLRACFVFPSLGSTLGVARRMLLHKILQLPATMRRPILAMFAAVASVSFAQDYGDNYADYADSQDNLYANYAAKQEAKAV